ncbi:antibiotic biosynthesis monooxygenase [Pullulanibacillus sp. KACC 23026]|uniref:antibiotic biosynthesis monooxygenase family protein n=1 Tax=Pullulanibacillus sp. KACC 23026 TaxID=3028315 RepID=UPI0023AEAC6B|nr:antibiotic biosynthesis monooxygenase [Pullulanibacillus sp. KACC 23026]WEG14655.1 antibiotic biosynthesis monooxygenase [Pullulanibacillus sp. KACC 23026]
MNRDAQYAVIFTSKRSETEEEKYTEAAKQMVELVRNQKGFIAIENVQDARGFGIMVSYWESLEAIHEWNRLRAHHLVQKKGRDTWYDYFTVHICKIEKMYDFQKEA